ncbi:MAG: hypothetical protein ACLSA6_04140 [Holdemania massiliensis]
MSIRCCGWRMLPGFVCNRKVNVPGHNRRSTGFAGSAAGVAESWAPVTSRSGCSRLRQMEAAFFRVYQLFHVQEETFDAL